MKSVVLFTLLALATASHHRSSDRQRQSAQEVSEEIAKAQAFEALTQNQRQNAPSSVAQLVAQAQGLRQGARQVAVQQAIQAAQQQVNQGAFAGPQNAQEAVAQVIAEQTVQRNQQEQQIQTQAAIQQLQQSQQRSQAQSSAGLFAQQSRQRQAGRAIQVILKNLIKFDNFVYFSAISRCSKKTTNRWPATGTSTNTRSRNSSRISQARRLCYSTLWQRPIPNPASTTSKPKQYRKYSKVNSYNLNVVNQLVNIVVMSFLVPSVKLKLKLSNSDSKDNS